MPTKLTSKTGIFYSPGFLKHFLFWLSILLFFTIFGYLTDQDPFGEILFENLIYLPHDILLTYLIISLLIPRFYLKKKYLIFGLSILGVLGINLIISFSIDNFLINRQIIQNPDKVLAARIFSSTTIFAFIASLASVFKLLSINSQVMLNKEVTEARYHKAEVALLKSQINPHFLFNTLNNINTLVFIDQQKTYEAILKLSEMMRYMHREQTPEFVSLEEELNYIENYVALQRLRFKDKEMVEFATKVSNKNVAIAPLLFIGFIENAFKHCNKKDLLPAITISIVADEQKIILEVKNHYQPKNKESDTSGGFGLKNIKNRLDLIYNNRYSLKIEDNGNIYDVILKIDVINGIQLPKT